jgi:hypothetical protein
MLHPRQFQASQGSKECIYVRQENINDSIEKSQLFFITRAIVESDQDSESPLG